MSDNKPPEPLYPCHFCNEEYSWPASDLHWSTRFKDWVCGECWCGNCHDDDYEPDEMGERLSDYLQDIKDKELAALRAKAKAYVEGFDAWAVFQGEEIQATSKTKDTSIAMSKKIAGYRNPHFDMWPTMELRGYTCRKVRVCKEVVE